MPTEILFVKEPSGECNFKYGHASILECSICSQPYYVIKINAEKLLEWLAEIGAKKLNNKLDESDIHRIRDEDREVRFISIVLDYSGKVIPCITAADIEATLEGYHAD